MIDICYRIHIDSQVAMEETATNSALVAEVTAKKSKINMTIAPVDPSKAEAAAGAGNPAETSAGESKLG